MQWFRFYAEALDDPKVQKLKPDMFKVWVNLMCLAAKHDGVLPDPEDMAFALRLSRAEMDKSLKYLMDARLIDIDETTPSEFQLHNWNGRQYKSDVSTDRVKRHRKRKRNVSPTVSETPPDTESETEQKDTSSPGAREAEQRVAVGNRVLEAAGMDPAKWVGDFSVVSGWLNAGYDVDLDILPAVKATMGRKRDGPPSTLNYFNKPIQKAYEARLSIPEATRQSLSADQERRAAENIQRLLAVDVKPADFKAATGRDAAEAEVAEIDAFLQAKSLELPEFLRRTA